MSSSSEAVRCARRLSTSSKLKSARSSPPPRQVRTLFFSTSRKVARQSIVRCHKRRSAQIHRLTIPQALMPPPRYVHGLTGLKQAFRPQIDVAIAPFPDTSLLRLCARAGIVSVSPPVLSCLSTIASAFLSKLMRHAASSAVHNHRNAVLAIDVSAFKGNSQVYGSGMRSELLERTKKAVAWGPLDWADAKAAEAEGIAELHAESITSMELELARPAHQALAETESNGQGDGHGEHADAADRLGPAYMEALSAIRVEQSPSNGLRVPLVPFLPFAQLLRDIAQDVAQDVAPKSPSPGSPQDQDYKMAMPMCFEARAVEHAYRMLEGYLLSLLEDANVYALHAKRLVVHVKDVQVALRAQGELDILRRVGRKF